MSAEVEQATSVIGNLSLSDISSWDKYYDNPKAEIILVSSDKVGFRVDAWQFKKESAFIRDLVTFPSDQSLELAPIELDHNNKIVRYFIDFVIAGSTSTAQISMTEFEELFQLSDKFMTENVDKALMVAMGLRTQQLPTPTDLSPWPVFKLAATRDNLELALISIRAFETAEMYHYEIYKAQLSKFDGIPGRYIAALLLAGYDVKTGYNYGHNTESLHMQVRTWSEVAEEFNAKMS